MDVSAVSLVMAAEVLPPALPTLYRLELFPLLSDLPKDLLEFGCLRPFFN